MDSTRDAGDEFHHTAVRRNLVDLPQHDLLHGRALPSPPACAHSLRMNHDGKGDKDAASARPNAEMEKLQGKGLTRRHCLGLRVALGNMIELPVKKQVVDQIECRDDVGREIAHRRETEF